MAIASLARCATDALLKRRATTTFMGGDLSRGFIKQQSKGARMTKYLAVLAGVLALVSCAERQEVPTTAAPSATLPQASAPSSSSGAREQANADLAAAQARLQEANREAERARSEWAAADAEAKSAQAQIDAANKGADSVAQARAAELARAAEAHQRSATTHLDYANKLVEARQADVEVAQLHVRTVEVGGGAAVSTSASPQTDPQLVAAQDAENAARTRAADLGRAALAAQRAWEDATGRARAGSPTDATTSGTGLGGTTDIGAATPPAPSEPAPAPGR
jgi:colicin import membrane protein